MHILLLIVAIHALLFAFGFLIAGWGALLMPDPDEEAKMKEDYERARQKGWIESWRWQMQFRREFASLDQLAAHWAERPDVRKYIYAGAACLAVAALLGIPLGAFK